MLTSRGVSGTAASPTPTGPSSPSTRASTSWAKPDPPSLSSNPLLTPVLLALLGGCQTSVSTPPPEVAAPEAAPDPVPARSDSARHPDGATRTTPLATYRRADPVGGIHTSATARLWGALALRDGCLVIEIEGGQTHQPVFPADEATWDDAGRRLTYGGQSYGLGDELWVGGGGRRRRRGVRAGRAAVPGRPPLRRVLTSGRRLGGRTGTSATGFTALAAKQGIPSVAVNHYARAIRLARRRSSVQPECDAQQPMQIACSVSFAI